MGQRQGKYVFSLALGMVMGVMMLTTAHAQKIIPITPAQAKINGSIPYSVIGHYKAHFEDFDGRITLDEKRQKIESVDLEIKVNSITSNCPWCDKIVKSPKLLNTRRYPTITFKSSRIMHDGEGYKVKGILEMHGIRKIEIFPFNARFIQRNQGEVLALDGSWSINRKDFHIIWNRLLDRGGLLVGDHMTVRWMVKTYLNVKERT